MGFPGDCRNPAAAPGPIFATPEEYSDYLLVLVLHQRALPGDQALKLQQPQCCTGVLRNPELRLQHQLVLGHRKAVPGPGCASRGCFCTRKGSNVFCKTTPPQHCLQGAAEMEKALNISQKVKSKVRNREANIPT